ncbi:thiol reductant ABC exporter subunit CydC [Actinoplanes sp. LDG1-06]|uniref:Thiol reductant ABC exporter subunit CydC n=1 Tax=Paractinoplanes ovalisporus TaxID=2810368 RepID=A0ABS2AT09_9ACTN|nr:thiol reductant ABC exporter subunit CydC [Actinoplanes ovalisporus]MBM2622961.1 thiol reductant ABC exporter subunit CydC [Actinoplanes ovalisporus]
MTSWQQLLRSAARPAAGGIAVAVLAGVGAAGAGVGLMATSAWLISRAALHPPVLHLMVAIVAVRAFGIGRGVLRYAERLAAHDAAFRALGRLRVRLFAHLERIAPAGLAGFRQADLTQRLAGDVDAVLDMLTRVLLPAAVAAIVGLASVLLIGSLSVTAGAALAAGILLVGVGVPWMQRSAARRSDGRLAPLRGELATGTVDLLQGLPDLLAYGADRAQLARLADVDARLRRAGERSAAAAGVSAAVTAVTTGLCVVVGLAAGAVAVRSGSLSGELLAVIVLTPLAVFETVGTVPVAAQRYAEARAALRRLAEVFSVSPGAEHSTTSAGSATSVIHRQARLWTTDDPPTAGGRVPGIPGWEGAGDGRTPTKASYADKCLLRVEKVSAAWPGGGPDVVRELDLDLEPGARVALTGPSGSGKTTVASLLVRFLDPTAGRITLNGVDLRDIAPDEVRRVVGYLPEDAYLFDTTIAGNLRLAREDASDDELRAALGQARLLDWVASLPQGLETLVGEHGMAISGGQRRRLALARALLAGFPILILDEPTEHLDDETAVALTRDLLAAAGDRAVLLITHRTGIASEVDRVISLSSQVKEFCRTPAA